MKPSDIIQQYGWVQHRYGSDSDGYCLVGAVYRAFRPSAASENANPNIAKILTRLRKRLGLPPTVWNDALGRTLRQVVEFLKAEGL